jgi:hypothetical protein
VGAWEAAPEIDRSFYLSVYFFKKEICTRCAHIQPSCGFLRRKKKLAVLGALAPPARARVSPTCLAG